MTKIWHDYYIQTKNKAPSVTLIKALSFVKNKNIALDLGSGALRDSKYLISKGFKKIVAVDKESSSAGIFDGVPKNKFEFHKSFFHKFKFPLNKYGLINAQYSLPFIEPKFFDAIFERIKMSLIHQGVFTGQFFGTRDEWNILKRGKMTFHTKRQVEDLFGDFKILELREEEKDENLANGKLKHWHVFNVIAVR